MAYFGVQGKTTAGNAPYNELVARFATPHGPRHWERATYLDNREYHTLLAIAYWSDVNEFIAWRQESGFDTWWQDPARQSDPVGYFVEVVTPTADRFETLFSSPDRPEGIGRLRQGVSGEVVEHAYWGGARDRIPVAQVDPLEPELVSATVVRRDTFGSRVLVPGRSNLALIRSGQDWSDTQGRERSLYLNDVQPTLEAGMRYLRDEGAGIGCLSCRYMTVLDESGGATEKTFGLAHFDSLASLEAWAKSHPTHLAIFGGFMRYVQELNFQIALRLYHEIAVVPAGGQYFEYVNCHPATGLLSCININT
jgi:aldoxime dehydratase